MCRIVHAEDAINDPEAYDPGTEGAGYDNDEDCSMVTIHFGLQQR